MFSSCAYRFGTGTKKLPDGYTTISVPIFKNESIETGVEAPFTEAMISEL